MASDVRGRMRRIWDDQVFSKVIAGIILIPIAGLSSFAWFYARSVFKGSEFRVHDLFGSTIELNEFMIVALLAFLACAGIAIVMINRLRKYDLYVAAPMSFDTNEEYQEFREECMAIVNEIRSHCKFKRIYCAAERIESLQEFSAAAFAAEDDLRALRRSRRFLLIYPRRSPTSAIFESGYAFRKNLPTVYFCSAEEDLPFLMRSLNDGFKRVRIYRANSNDEFRNYIRKHSRKLFKPSR